MEGWHELPQRVNEPRLSRSTRIAIFRAILQISHSLASLNAFTQNEFGQNTA